MKGRQAGTLPISTESLSRNIYALHQETLPFVLGKTSFQMIAGSYFGGMSAGVKTAVGDAIFEKGIKADHQSNPGWLFKSYWALLLLPNVKIWRRERFIDGHARRQMARALKTPNSLKGFSKAPF